MCLRGRVENAFEYRPSYAPIPILVARTRLSEPLWFWMEADSGRPVEHPNGCRRLVGCSVTMASPPSDVATRLAASRVVTVRKGAPLLTVELADGEQGSIDLRPEVPLRLRCR